MRDTVFQQGRKKKQGCAGSKIATDARSELGSFLGGKIPHSHKGRLRIVEKTLVAGYLSGILLWCE